MPEDWEVPFDDADNGFAIWVHRGSYSTVSGRYIPNKTAYVALSNDRDSSEDISLQTVEQIDDLIIRLQSARVWLEGVGR